MCERVGPIYMLATVIAPKELIPKFILKDHHLSFLSNKKVSMEQWQKLDVAILSQKFEK